MAKKFAKKIRRRRFEVNKVINEKKIWNFSINQRKIGNILCAMRPNYFFISQLAYWNFAIIAHQVVEIKIVLIWKRNHRMRLKPESAKKKLIRNLRRKPSQMQRDIVQRKVKFNTLINQTQRYLRDEETVKIKPQRERKNMNGKELLIMIERKRVLRSDTIKNQRWKMFNSRRCRTKFKTKNLLDYQTTWKD